MRSEPDVDEEAAFSPTFLDSALASADGAGIAVFISARRQHHRLIAEVQIPEIRRKAGTVYDKPSTHCLRSLKGFYNFPSRLTSVHVAVKHNRLALIALTRYKLLVVVTLLSSRGRDGVAATT